MQVPAILMSDGYKDVAVTLFDVRKRLPDLLQISNRGGGHLDRNG